MLLAEQFLFPKINCHKVILLAPGYTFHLTHKRGFSTCGNLSKDIMCINSQTRLQYICRGHVWRRPATLDPCPAETSCPPCSSQYSSEFSNNTTKYISTGAEVGQFKYTGLRKMTLLVLNSNLKTNTKISNLHPRSPA